MKKGCSGGLCGLCGLRGLWPPETGKIFIRDHGMEKMRSPNRVPFSVRVACLSAALIFGLLAVIAPVWSQNEATGSNRFALVIGNGDYVGLGKLKNPVNDAQDIGTALTTLGFQVDVLTDASLESMEQSVLRLRDELSATRDSTGFFFYAGHGVQSAGENYLIPVDAHIPSESLLKTRAIPLQFVLDSLGESHNELNIVVLDACRDNPFSWARSGTRGLTVVGAPPPGSIIAYATSVGSVAQDGTGRNGAFTEELLKNLETPGLDIGEVFRRTGAGVKEKTSSAQIPAIYSQYFGFAYLAGGNPASGGENPAFDYLPAFFDGASDSAKTAISKAEELTYSGSWLSAWNVLADSDPDNTDPFVFAEKLRIAINGNIYTDMYQSVGFVDLKPGSDLETARSEGIQGAEYFDFNPHEIVNAMEKQGTEIPPVLATALGDYYYDFLLFSTGISNGWIGDEQTVASLAIHWYQIAYDNYILDTVGMTKYAEMLVKASRAQEAVAILREAIDLEPDNIDLQTRLVDALVEAKQLDEAFKELDAIIAKAASPQDAFSFYEKGAQIAFEHERQSDVERYIAALEKNYPEDWLAGTLRLKLAVRSGDIASAQTLADGLVSRFPKDENVLGQILITWLSYPSGIDAGYSFLSRHIEVSKGNPSALATFYLYRAAYRYRVLTDQGTAPNGSAPKKDKKAEMALILADLDTSETNLKASAAPDDERFGFLKDFRDEITKSGTDSTK
jgi:tetratricopeptide (TPR) repeat protein